MNTTSSLTEAYGAIKRVEQNANDSTVNKAVAMLVELTVNGSMTREEIMELSKKAVQKLIYSKPLSSNQRKMLNSVLQKMADIFNDK